MVNDLDMKKEVAAFVGIVFLLLGVLFGMQIMTFIFGNLSETSTTLGSITRNVVNETGGFINASGYTLGSKTVAGFSSPSIVQAVNTSNGEVISSGNFTLSSVGVVTNASSLNGSLNSVWNVVSFTYEFSADSDAKITADAVTNNSLSAIATYTNQSNTQFNTAAIAITLLILIAIFAIFWKVFMSSKGGLTSGGGGGKGRGSFGGSDRNFS